MSVHIFGRGRAYRLRFWHERAQDTEGELLDLRGDEARALSFARALTAGAAMGTVRRLLGRELHGIHRLEDAEVAQRLAEGLARGSIVAVRLPRDVLPTYDGIEDEPPPAESERARAEPKTWIEIELVDTEGKPVPNEPYWIQLPDGTVREGRLGSNGRAYFGDLDPGECDVRFPDLDNEAVAAPGEPKKPKGRPLPEKPRKTWIEIELVGMDGRAVPNELYRIALPGGTSVEGRLNERGRARVTGLDPGTCTVTFPELDMDAWEPL